MRDLAKVGQLLANRGKGLLRPRAFAEMTRVHWRFDGANGLGEDGTSNGFFCAYGLAVQHLATARADCHDDPFGDGTARIGHAGDAYALKSGLWLDPVTGKGLAFFTTQVGDDSKGTRSAFTAAEEDVIRRALAAH